MTDWKSAPPECLETEIIAAYIDARLGTAQERERVEAHLAGCPECYELFTETVRLRSDLIGEAPAHLAQVGFRSRRTGRAGWMLAAGGTLAAAAALWLALAPPAALVRWWRPGSRPELTSVVAAVGSHRAVEGRLTGGFAHGPPPAVVRAPVGSAPDNADLQIALGHLMREAADDLSARSLAALGTARLAAGRIDQGIASLEEAVALDSQMSQAWSDLAAAYLARGAAPAASADVPRALDSADRALALNPGLLEARFNRALALERMGLTDRAAQAWRDYLAADADSPWAEEARTRLTDLEQRGAAAAGTDAQSARERLFDEVLPAWADAPDAAARAARLTEAEDLVLQLRTMSPDRLAADVFEPLRAGVSSDQVEGLRAYGRARALYKASTMDGAALEFDRVMQLLEGSGSALALSAAHYRATVAYRRREGDLEGRFSRVDALARERRYFSLSGRSAWMLGVLATARGAYLTARQHYSVALEDFERAAERANAASVHMLLAQNAERLGEPERAWTDLIVALGGNRREGTLLQSAQAALRLGWPYAAAELQAEAAEVARAADRLPNLVDALRLQALTQHAIGRVADAKRLLGEARTILASQQDTTWDRLRAEVALVEAQVAGPMDAAGVIPAASEALEYFRSAGMTARLPEGLFARARLGRLTGRLDEAREDLSSAVAILTRERDGLAPGMTRMAFAERVRRLGDELVSLEIAAGAPDRALQEADRLRSWDLVSSNGTVPVDLTALRRALEPRTSVIYYAVGEDAAFVWALRPSGIEVHQLRAARAELQRLTDAIRSDALDSSALDRLFDLTLGPVSHALAAGDRVVIVPDGPLHGLPFAALPGVRARFLIEDVTIAYAPSLGALVAASSRLQTLEAPVSVLAVGNPRLDPAWGVALPTLKGAASEARQVAEIYPARRVLVEDQATSEALAGALPEADVLHFAGHAVVNDLEPEASHLAIAGAAGEPLSASAVSRLPAARVGLVVLAACQGLGGRSGRGQGPMNLARAFLQAGVPAVVASRWLVDDVAAVRFSEELHRAYRETGDAAAALRRAQLGLIGSSDGRLSAPSAWAGWTVIGGDRTLARSLHSGKEKS